MKHTLQAEDQELLDLARAARDRAYAPYSHYQVGAAIRSADGRLWTGCNVEVSSYPLTCCAERIAAFKAVSEGQHRLVAAAVITDDPHPGSPCGACRQVLHDFGGPEMRMVLGNLRGDVRICTLGELLPEAFGPEDLLRR